MSDVEDEELVAAIAFGLTYFYYKFKQVQQVKQVQQTKIKRRKRRRCWMTDIHRKRIRTSLEEKFNELLYEPSGEFHSFCRMTLADFEYLLDKISPMISKKDTDFRQAIPAKYRLAITLRFLSSGDNYKSLHYLFKVSPQIVSKIIPEVCKAINKVLKNEMKMPLTADSWMDIEREYSSKFPHCLGSIDCKRIVIARPPIDEVKKFNYKKTFSIPLLTLIDANYKFIYADIAYQGSEDSVFGNTLLWKKLCGNELDFPTPSPLPGSEVDVPYVFIGDGAFPLSTHVMRPYPGGPTGPRKIFNQNLTRARAVVENAFGILQSVFGIFRRPIDLHPNTVPEITMTCLLIHNYLRERSPESYTPKGSFDVIDGNGDLITLGSWRRHETGYSAIKTMPNVSCKIPVLAKQIREEFTTYFCKSSEQYTTKDSRGLDNDCIIVN